VRRALYAGAFAALFALAFPVRAGDVHFDLGTFAGWLALIPFALLLRGLSPLRAFGWAWGSGAVALCAIIPWLYVVVYVHGHAPGWIAVLAVVGLSAYVGLHVGIAGWLAALAEPAAGRLGLLALPAAWVVSEHLRTFSVSNGFPWAFLGYSAHRNGPLLELGSLAGVYGLTFLLALFAALAVRRRVVAAVALVVVAHVVGFGLRLAAEPEPVEGLRWAGLVQASIPQGEKWDPDKAQQAFDAHVELSRLVAASGEVDLIVWPEASAPVFLQMQEDYRNVLLDLARETGAVLLVGGVAVEPIEGGRGFSYANSLFQVSPHGQLVDRYDKSILVPFGEFVPWRSVLGFLSGVATGIAAGDLTPGPGAGTLAVGASTLAPLICYEVLYPNAVRGAVLRGARVLVNVTNDAWYGRSSAPHQFVAMAAMRSAEHGLPMLRAANTGVSAVVDSGGVVLRDTPIFERAALRVPLPGARRGPTLYTLLGDWIVWLSWGFLLVTGGRRVVGRVWRSGARDAGTDSRPE
jgi:apolipoprotein N-acyltransferase